MANAQEKVFETTELMEQILLHLPPRSLILARVVCQQFRSVIATSTAIRQMLFLEPDSSSNALRRNDLIPRRNHTFHLFDLPKSRGWWPGCAPEPDEPLVQCYIYISNILADDKGSWREMLPCQPPPSMVAIRHAHKNIPKVVLLPKDGKHVTLGQIEQTIRAFWPETYWRRGGRKMAEFFAYGPKMKKWYFEELNEKLYVVGEDEESMESFVERFRKEYQVFL